MWIRKQRYSKSNMFTHVNGSRHRIMFVLARTPNVAVHIGDTASYCEFQKSYCTCIALTWWHVQRKSTCHRQNQNSRVEAASFFLWKSCPVSSAVTARKNAPKRLTIVYPYPCLEASHISVRCFKIASPMWQIKLFELHAIVWLRFTFFCSRTCSARGRTVGADKLPHFEREK